MRWSIVLTLSVALSVHGTGFPDQAAAQCARPSTAHTTVSLPNITKTLGGPDGWHTPFIVQNTSRTEPTALEIDLYRFSDGALVARREVCALAPATSFVYEPNADPELPHDSQFSAVVRSYMTEVVAVVNQHAGAGPQAQAASYIGATRGATSVSLPNVVKTFYGFATPFIIQNVGTRTATVTARFNSFDGTHVASVTRTIEPGRARPIEPDAEPALRDATQYAVTVSAGEPLAVVVNTHFAANGRRTVSSYNGLVEGTSPLLGSYAVKGVPGVGKGISTIVVQNAGTGPTAASLAFRPLGGGPVTRFERASLAPGASWAFDPRSVRGDPAAGTCGTAASNGCLGDGEYSFIASADNDAIAAVVNLIGEATAATYAPEFNGAARVHLPNVTRALGGPGGWTTPVVVQANTASGATLSWYRFGDGTLVATQAVVLGPGVSRWIDPRDVAGLADDAQYSVVIEGTGGTVGAIVLQLTTSGGDGAMAYEGFLGPAASGP